MGRDDERCKHHSLVAQHFSRAWFLIDSRSVHCVNAQPARGQAAQPLPPPPSAPDRQGQRPALCSLLGGTVSSSDHATPTHSNVRWPQKRCSEKFEFFQSVAGDARNPRRSVMFPSRWRQSAPRRAEHFSVLSLARKYTEHRALSVWFRGLARVAFSECGFHWLRSNR